MKMCIMNKKAKSLLLMLCLLVAAVGLIACGSESGEADADFHVTISLADHLSADHPYMKNASVKFMDLVTERTEGRVDFIHYPSTQAGAMKDHINMMQTRIVDMANSPAAIFSEQLPLSNVVNLPSWGLTTDKLALAYYDLATDESSALYQNDFAANKIKMLFCGCFPYYQMQSNKPLETIDDFKNLVVRSPGGSMDLILQNLGCSVISVDPTELYEAMQRGTIDAMYSPQESLIPQALNEVMTHSTDNLDLNSFIMMWDINLDLWNSLPADIQEIMVECGREVTESFSTELLKCYDEAQVDLEAQGIVYTELSEQDLATMHEMISTVPTDWVNSVDAKGLAGTETYEAFRELVEKYKQ